MSVVSADIEPLTFIFADDGLVPNNPLPFLVYKGAVDVANDHPEASPGPRDSHYLFRRFADLMRAKKAS